MDQVFNELDSGRCGGVGQRVKALLEGVLRHCLVVAHCGTGDGGEGESGPPPQIMALADKVCWGVVLQYFDFLPLFLLFLSP